MANANSLTVNEGQTASINVISNDTDPDGDYPLTLVSVSSSSGAAYVASGTNVGWYGAPAGTYSVQYVVKDSRGATATGTLTVTSRWVNPCGNQPCP